MSEKSDKPSDSASPTNAEMSKIPSWLDSDFIASIFQKYFNDESFRIVRMDMRSATGKGDNYGSSMLRVNITHTTDEDDENLSLIAKIPVSDEKALEVIRGFNAYTKEIEFYSQLAPKINVALGRLNATEPFIANCYGVCPTRDVILLEDLAVKSYCLLKQFFNFDETKFIFERLASFHAINAVLQQQQPNIFENFKYGTWNNEIHFFLRSS